MREMWNKSWNVNTTSTYILTHTLMPLLLKSSDPRLIFITSGTSTLAETTNTALAVNRSPAEGWPKQSLGVPAYRSSKTGMNSKSFSDSWRLNEKMLRHHLHQYLC